MHHVITTIKKGPGNLLLTLFLISTSFLQAQNCAEIISFEAVQYDQFKAKYEWTNANDANFYTLKIQINNQLYLATELPANTSNFNLEFTPHLKHNDHVEAQLTKHCPSGAKTEAATDFIIITDAVLYLIGDPKNDGKIKVEPVYAPKENLDPANEICGLCDPSFFRLTAGFYGPYGIAVSTAASLPMEQVRFDKSELCGCLQAAINAGIMDPDGGPGPQYTGTPYPCTITPYSFQKIDCEQRGKERDTPENDLKTPENIRVQPNPVVHNAVVDFNLHTASPVRIELYDLLGNSVKTLFDATFAAEGSHQISFQTDELASGVYYCTLRTAEQVRTTKFVVSK